jgi:hypothetical protein
MSAFGLIAMLIGAAGIYAVMRRGSIRSSVCGDDLAVEGATYAPCENGNADRRRRRARD